MIDECHNFLNLPHPIEDILAEARGFRVAITLAHQHLGQFPRELREGMSTNARSKIFFNASPEDSRELSRHTAPRLSDHDLAHLGVYRAAVRLVLNGEQAQPLTLRTQPLPPRDPRPSTRDPRHRPATAPQAHPRPRPARKPGHPNGPHHLGRRPQSQQPHPTGRQRSPDPRRQN